MKPLIILILLSSFVFANLKTGIILSDGVRLRANPQLSSDNVIGVVNASEEVIILNSESVNGDNWINIETAVKQRGWISKRFVSAPGEDGIKQFCLNNLNNVIRKRNLPVTEKEFNKILALQGRGNELVKAILTENIPLDIAAYILLLQRDGRGVEVLVESLKKTKKEEIFFALQVVANKEIVDNTYEAFKTWVSSKNTNEIKIDDFSLVRIFNHIR